MEAINALRAVIPFMSDDVIEAGLIKSLKNYIENRTDDECAIALKLAMQGMELKMIHNRDPENFKKITDDALEASQLQDELTSIKRNIAKG